MQIVLLLIPLAFIALLYQWQKAQMQRIALAWADAARVLGGTFTPAGGGLFSRTPMKIAARIDGVDVLIDHYTVSTGKTSTTYTRISAWGIAPAELTLKVYVEGFFSTIGKALGTQDVNVGHKQFDEVFMVKASNEDLARAWIGDDLAVAALRARAYSLAIESGRATSTRIGIEPDPGLLVNAAREVALFAGRGAAMLAAWREVADALGGGLVGERARWPGDPDAAIRVERRGVVVTVALRVDAAKRGALTTRVAAERASAAGDHFAMELRTNPAEDAPDPFGDPALARAYELASSDPARALRRMDEETRRAIVSLEPERVACDESAIEVVLGGAGASVAELESAVAIVAALAASAPEGPYR